MSMGLFFSGPFLSFVLQGTWLEASSFTPFLAPKMENAKVSDGSIFFCFLFKFHCQKIVHWGDHSEKTSKNRNLNQLPWIRACPRVPPSFIPRFLQGTGIQSTIAKRFGFRVGLLSFIPNSRSFQGPCKVSSGSFQFHLDEGSQFLNISAPQDGKCQSI